VSEIRTLRLVDLQLAGPIWGSGRERRAICPFCGDDHRHDQAHASLALNVETGAWVCHRCGGHGRLGDDKQHHDRDVDEGAPRRRRRRRPRPPATTPREPSPAELKDRVAKRATLRRLWTAATPIDVRAARPGSDYLWSRGIPLLYAVEARVRYAKDWYGRPAVAFPVIDGAGRLLAAEGRHIDGHGDPKSRSAGSKGAGVFVASPGALETDGLAIAEGPITALSLAVCGLPALALCGHAGAPSWLVRRLALRTVYLALDWHEQGAEEAGARLASRLAAVGARPYRLRPMDVAGDWNDYLCAVGLATARAALCGRHIQRP